MSKDFQNAAHWAKEHLAVPPLDEQRIFQRSRHENMAQRLRILAVTALGALLIAGTGTGFAQKVYNGMHIWLSGSSVSVRVESLAVTQYPTASEFRSIASRTVVPFVYPVGLAANLKIKLIAVWPLDHPNTVSLIYTNGTGALKGITIIANSAVEKGTPPMPTVHGTGVRWSIGSEQVLAAVDSKHGGNDFIARVRAAMQHSTPAASVADNVNRTHNVIVLGGFESTVRQAEAMVQGTGAVLIDRGHLTKIPELAAQGQPLLASRTAVMTNIPQQNGSPDYTHATYARNNTVVLSAEAVRQVNKTLSAHGGAAKCACELLYRQSAGGPSVTVLQVP